MKHTLFFFSLVGMLLLPGCSGPGEAADTSPDYPVIFPDYTEVTVPVSIAPLNFQVEDAEKVKAEFVSKKGDMAFTVTGDNRICIPEKKWKQLLERSEEVYVTLSVWDKKHPQGVAYRPFPIYVSCDSIDSHVVYRLIDPGYEPWHQMGIYQRELSSYKENCIINNHRDNGMCINCHTSYRNSPSTFLYHQRGENGGTVFVKDGKVTKVNLAAVGPKKQGVYPAWHPGGRYVAFSSNQTRQSFSSEGNKVLEVYDLGSDLILYDTERQEVLADTVFNGEESWETFPAWSPDGKYLYYCVAHAIPYDWLPYQYQSVKYALVRAGFSEKDARFTTKRDTLYHPAYRGGSASHPRVSPDGRYLLYTEASCGTFPIWHQEAELRLIDLQERKELDASVLNSSEAESFHSWSSNGRWILFVSRRMDGRHTRLYIAHFGVDGNPGKPFLLPQRNPEENRLRIASYNAPEFVDGVIRHEPIN